MTTLNTKPNINDPDGFYAELIAVHDGLTDDESAALNARLILLLSNHIGDRATLTKALTEAKKVRQNREET
ncbi:DUF2783 domain-containing protein [Paracoccus tegillarcae]|uniref:DUF2783 domain-containing protein n=1 Tax=Paracoccus tegillarcae TaxID=1529068 RepID=A0A2K9EHY0_9RHOB|nr:DUF2783 domain-containing protein [Paracoccus tegillarcae]AUH34583.1 DUF2783 domain-containing protein [Paracoccus tegillarcae]